LLEIKKKEAFAQGDYACAVKENAMYMISICLNALGKTRKAS